MLHFSSFHFILCIVCAYIIYTLHKRSHASTLTRTHACSYFIFKLKRFLDFFNNWRWKFHSVHQCIEVIFECVNIEIYSYMCTYACVFVYFIKLAIRAILSIKSIFLSTRTSDFLVLDMLNFSLDFFCCCCYSLSLSVSVFRFIFGEPKRTFIYCVQCVCIHYTYTLEWTIWWIISIFENEIHQNLYDVTRIWRHWRIDKFVNQPIQFQ